MRTKYLITQRESRNPFSPNYDRKFHTRVKSPIRKEENTSNNMGRRTIVYG